MNHSYEAALPVSNYSIGMFVFGKLSKMEKSRLKRGFGLAQRYAPLYMRHYQLTSPQYDDDSWGLSYHELPS